MKRFFVRIAFTMFLIGTVSLCANGKELMPVGQVVGLELRDGSVVVASFDEELGSGCADAGVQIGDEIRRIDDIEVKSSADVRKALQHSDGAVTITVSRNGKVHELQLQSFSCMHRC